MPLPPFPMTYCAPVSATKTGLEPGVEHNVTVVKPVNDPSAGFVMLFQSFE